MSFGAGPRIAVAAATAAASSAPAATGSGPRCSVVYATIVYRRSMPVRLALAALGHVVPGFRRVVTDTPRYRVLADPPIITKRLDEVLNSKHIASFVTLHLLMHGCYASAPTVTTLRPEALTTTSEPEADFRVLVDPDVPEGRLEDGQKILVVVPKGPIWVRRFRRALILSTTGAVIGAMGVLVDYLACHALAEALIKSTSAAGGMGNVTWKYRVRMVAFATLSTVLIILACTVISEPRNPVYIKPDASSCQAVAALRHIAGVLRDAASVNKEYEARISNGWRCSMLDPSTWDTSVMFSADIDRVSKAAGLWLALRALLGAGTEVGVTQGKPMVDLVTRADNDGAAHMLALRLRGELPKQPCGTYTEAVYQAAEHALGDSKKTTSEGEGKKDLEQGILRFVYASALRTVAHDWAFYTVAELFAKQQDNAKRCVLDHHGCTDELRTAIVACDAAVRERTTYIVPVMNLLDGIDGDGANDRNDHQVAAYMKHVLHTSLDPDLPPIQAGRFRVYRGRKEVDAGAVRRRELVITVSNYCASSKAEGADDEDQGSDDRSEPPPPSPSLAIRVFSRLCSQVYDPWKPVSPPMQRIGDLIGLTCDTSGGIHEDFSLPLTVRYALDEDAGFSNAELRKLDDALDDALMDCYGSGLSYHIFGAKGQAGAIAQLITPHLCDSGCAFAFNMRDRLGGELRNYCANGGVHLQPVALHTLDADPVFDAKGAERLKGMPWVRHMRFESQPGLLAHVGNTIIAKAPRVAQDPQLIARHFGTHVRVQRKPSWQWFRRSANTDADVHGVSQGRDFAMVPEPAVAAALCGSDAVTQTTRDKFQLRFVYTVPSVFQLALAKLSCLNYVPTDAAFQGAS